MGQPDPLLGRDDELARLESFLGDVRARGSALCLYGDPGIGKTALLDSAERLASAQGIRVIRASGSPVESDLDYATLHELLLPLADRVGGLSDDHRAALTGVLGLDGSDRPDAAAVTVAMSALLRPGGDGRATLIIVDDLQWADPGSLIVLSGLVAAAPGRRTGVLTASRSATSLPEAPELVRVGPIDDAASAALLDRGPGPAGRTYEQALAVAAGNPLILTELGSTGWSGAEVPPGRLRDSYAAELAPVPDDVRRSLLLAALDDSEDIDLPDADGRLSEARRLRIVVAGPVTGRLRFRDPLLRRTVVDSATSAERAQAHRELAQHFRTDPQRNAWHLAQASFHPDDQVAGLLEQGARQSLRDGRAAAASVALVRAAELSTTATDRARRLVEAAWVATDVRADLRAGEDLLQAARAADPDLRLPLMAAVAARVLADGDGDLDSAHRLLAAAVDRGERFDSGGSGLIEAMFVLVDVCRYGQRDELWQPLESAFARLRPGPPPLLLLYAHSQRGPGYVTRADLAVMNDCLRSLPAETDPVRIGRIATSARALDRGPDCRPALQRAIEDGRAGGAVGTAMAALHTAAMDGYALGDWDDAEAYADELVRTAEARASWYAARLGRTVPVLVAAGRGDAERVRRDIQEIAAWSTPRGLDSLAQWCYQVQASAAVASGSFEDAYQHCTSIAAPGTLPRGAAAIFSGYDLVEAALRTNRIDQADAHAKALAATSFDLVSDRLALMVAGTAAMVARDADADARFTAALALPGAARYRFESARLRLYYGERLRRARRLWPAREQLSTALDEFRRLRAVPWIERAGRELDATTAGRRRSTTPGLSQLTPQEREVAELAAGGLTNKQIAERLLLSPRTVASHLRQAYQKLAISSRSPARVAMPSFGKIR